MAASQSSVSNSIIECSICLETFNDPRSLPCFHSFCLNCIDGYSQNKLPSDRMQCPLCRSEFNIPRIGLSGLPRNLFLLQLLQVQVPSIDNVSSSSEVDYWQWQDCIDDGVFSLREQMKRDVTHLAVGVGQLSEMLTSVEKQKQDFKKSVSDAELIIVRRAEEMKDLIDRNRQELLDELTSQKVSVVNNCDNLIWEITQQMSFIENLKMYAEDLSDQGAASVISQEASTLHDRVKELTNLEVLEFSRNLIKVIGISFTESDLLKAEDVKVLGKIKLIDGGQVSVSTLPTLTHVLLREALSVVGVTSLSGRLYVARHNAEEQIEMYDAELFAWLGNISVPGLRSAYGLASCGLNDCLYASDWNGDLVYKVKLSAYDEAVSSWSVSKYPVGLSVSGLGDVLVTCCKSRQLQQYTADGHLIRKIYLQPGVFRPWHAVQLTDGRYAVSHSQPGVCIVDVNGRVTNSYNNEEVEAAMRLNQPGVMALTSSGFILVADSVGNQLFLMDPTMTYAQNFALPVNCALHDPWTICLDESRGRLYVGEWSGSRLLVFDNVFQTVTNDM